MIKRRKKSKRNLITYDTNKRIYTLVVFVLVISVALSWRLYYLQIIKGDYYSAAARGASFERQIQLPRGNVYFRDKGGDGQYLAATNEPRPLLYADPREVEDEEVLLNQIAEIIEIETEDYELILNRLKNKKSSYALIKKELTKDEAEKINDFKLKGVYARPELVRIYPAGKVGASALGFLGFREDKRIGQYGVEEAYDEVLSGVSFGSGVLDLFSKNENTPSDLYLTIDYSIQFMVEKKLEEIQNNLDADFVSAIFMDPSTGEILTMAQKPGFNPNSYQDVSDVDIFKNTMVQSSFELGSVFKPITVASAIDGGAITPQTVYNDTGVVNISGYTIRNSDGQAHQLQTITEALEKSLNTGMVFVQQQLGKKSFRDYLEAFQLDKWTGIDLSGEVGGNIENIKNTNRDINFATASFGQGISFSPLRFLTSFSAIANNGKIMKPFLVKKVTNNTGETITEPKEMGQPISALTASRVTAMMVSVTENGFGKKAAVEGYNVATKTGTAQIPNVDGPGYSTETIHGFVGFAPAYNPKFVGFIMAYNPKQGPRFSADSVAPVFGDIASFILQYYKIPPQ